VREYTRGIWETVNYSIKLLENGDKEDALGDLRSLKNDLENGIALNFENRVNILPRQFPLQKYHNKPQKSDV